jgi:hypothetical protein
MGTRLKVASAIFNWILLWLSCGLISVFLLEPAGISTLNNYIFSALYFGAYSLMGLALYRFKGRLPHHQHFRQLLPLLLASIVGVVLLSRWYDSTFPLDADGLQRALNTHIYFQLFTYSTWLVKLADITFQQVYIVILIKELTELQLSKKQVIYWFAGAFTFLHLPLFYLFQWKAFYFILPASSAGFIFSYLIVNYKKGVFYSYAIHLIFYLALGICMRQFLN